MRLPEMVPCSTITWCTPSLQGTSQTATRSGAAITPLSIRLPVCRSCPLQQKAADKALQYTVPLNSWPAREMIPMQENPPHTHKTHNHSRILGNRQRRRRGKERRAYPDPLGMHVAGIQASEAGPATETGPVGAVTSIAGLDYGSRRRRTRGTTTARQRREGRGNATQQLRQNATADAGQTIAIISLGPVGSRYGVARGGAGRLYLLGICIVKWTHWKKIWPALMFTSDYGYNIMQVLSNEE